MSTFKKLLALTLALAMVLSVSVFAGYKADTYKDAAAIDADCKSAIELMYALEIMKGDNNGNFNPEATITRAEVAKMIYVILNYGKDDLAVNYKGAKIFSDVNAGDWFEGYVNYAATTKLVNGRGNGTFGPNDPVTCAEAAKMLLTAIGYSSEARGYTGANWSGNVLSDAAILGLLNGYDFNTNSYAPRQWVAVMFANALDCLTFNTMVPSFNGLLVNGSTGYEGYQTMGKKYYKLDSFTSVAVATTNASIDVDKNGKQFASDYVLFANGMEVKGTGLGAMDLGQKYKVIYKDGTTDVAYSVRSLSETAEARLLDMDVEVKYGTSSNKAQNKYEFTIDGMTAKFNAATINVLRTGNLGYADTTNSQTDAETLNVISFYSEITAPTRTNDLFKAIDTDCDGDIDYMIVTEYDYAVVTKDGDHNKYGKYIIAGDLTFNGQTKLYIEDCIISEDEIVEDNVVKYTWDLDEGMFVMEVLPVVEDVVYEARDNDEKIYTIGGEDYYVSGQALTRVQEWLDAKANLDEEICLVVDGDLIVYHWFSDSDYTDIADINAQLAVLIDVDATYSTGTLHEKQYIEYMTIDGEKHIAEYQDKAGYVPFASLVGFSLDNYAGEQSLDHRLFIIHEGTKGRVYLEKLDPANVNTQLDASTSLLNEYEIIHHGAGKGLDATGSAVKLAGNTMAADNSFFYAYDDDGEPVFGVITPAELGDGSDADVYAQTLNYVKSPSGKTTVLAGYVVFELTSDSGNDYLYITEIGRETSDGIELTIKKLGAEETEVIYYDGNAPLYENWLYAYTYYTMDDEYELYFVSENAYTEWYDEEYTELCVDPFEGAEFVVDVSDDDEVDHIVVVTLEGNRNETQNDSTDIDWLHDNWMDDPRTLVEVTYDELTEGDIVYGEDTDSYFQAGYTFYDADAEVLYLVVYRSMKVAQ